MDVTSVETRISDIENLMIENKLQVNDDKTDRLLMRPNKCAQSINRNILIVGHNAILFSISAESIGFYLRDDRRIDAHVRGICGKAFIDIRHLLTIDAAKTLVRSLVQRQLDYCNNV